MGWLGNWLLLLASVVPWRTFNIHGTFQIQVLKINCSLKGYFGNQKSFFYGKKKIYKKLLGTLFLWVQDYWCLGSLIHQFIDIFLKNWRYFVELFLWKTSHFDCNCQFLFSRMRNVMTWRPFIQDYLHCWIRLFLAALQNLFKYTTIISIWNQNWILITIPDPNHLSYSTFIQYHLKTHHITRKNGLWTSLHVDVEARKVCRSHCILLRSA